MGVASTARTAAARFGIVGELFSFFWSNKRWWMVPMLASQLHHAPCSLGTVQFRCGDW
jgi:hypothetical protein